MGLIRILLAITVVIAHSSSLFGFYFVRGQLAVQIFFVISGFYMALILTEKYNKKSDYKLFLSNRFLKIFPTYYIVLFACLVFQLIYAFVLKKPDIFAIFNPNIHINLFPFITLMLTNLTIFGQDIIDFMGVNSQGNLFFTPYFEAFPDPLYKWMLVPQAWTLAVELTFYLIVPFLNRLKSKYLLIIMFLSLVLRLTLYHYGLNQNPWNYRFFPNEILFFVSGIISFRLYQKIKNIEINPKISIPIYSLYLSFLIFYQFIGHNRTKETLLFLSTIVLLPLFFKLTKNNKFDRAIGELSYPVYICHFLIIDLFTHLTKLNHQYLGLVASIISILVSILISKFILNPIDKHRQSRLNSNALIL